MRKQKQPTDKFSPGPWVAHFNVPAAAIPGHIIKTEADPQFPVAAIWEGGGTRGRPLQVANAVLIAAAPQMLEALRLMSAHYSDLCKSNKGWMGKIVLQDYELLNRALVAMESAIATATTLPHPCPSV
jgi:hypothetical protein